MWLRLWQRLSDKLSGCSYTPWQKPLNALLLLSPSFPPAYSLSLSFSLSHSSTLPKNKSCSASLSAPAVTSDYPYPAGTGALCLFEAVSASFKCNQLRQIYWRAISITQHFWYEVKKKKHCWLLLEKKHIQGCILPRRLFPINYVNLNRRTSFDWKAHLKHIFITQLQLFQASVLFPHLSMHSVFIAHIICTNNMLTE